MITATLTKPRHIAAANAMWNAAMQRGGNYETASNFVQEALETLGESWADSTGVDKIGVAEFVLRFTPTEFGAAQTRALTDPIAEAVLASLRAVSHVRLGSDAALQGVGYLVSVGVLTAERSLVVLGY